MVWANATDNQQVVKPDKPVAAISRFAKIKNTQPWYQHFNLVVSPEFSGNHFSGEEVVPINPGISYFNFNYNKDEQITSLHGTLGGQIKSDSIYARVRYAKTDLSVLRDVAKYISDDTGDRLDYQIINHIEENGHMVELSLFGQHQFTPFLHIGYEIYREYYEIEGIGIEISKKDPIPNVYNAKGEAWGGRIELGARYDFSKTQLTMDYAYSRERYQGEYFGDTAFTKLGHHVELAIYQLWQYGLSTELNFGQTHEDANYPTNRRENGNNISQRASFEVKKLVTENAALSLNYTRINFSDYRQDYDFAAWFLRLDYQFSNDKPPRRRKRHNSLMRGL